MDENNLIPLIQKVPDIDVEERITECFLANVTSNEEHQKKCPYCIVNRETGKMIFEILAKDMVNASKNKRLTLTSFDLKQVLTEVLWQINQFEDNALKNEKLSTTEEGRTDGDGSDSGFTVGVETTSQGESEIEQGIGEIVPFSRTKRKDPET